MAFPTLNRIINFRPAGSPSPVPALVCGVDPSKTDGVHLHLTVFDPVKGPYLLRGVQGTNQGQEEGQWCWPTLAGAGVPMEPKPPVDVVSHFVPAGGITHDTPTPEADERARQIAERIDRQMEEARRRGRDEAKTLDQEVRQDIADDPIGYGDERNSGNGEATERP